MDEAIAFRIQKCLVSLLADKPSSEKDLSAYVHGRMKVQIERMSARLPRLQSDDAIESLLNKMIRTVTQTLKRAKTGNVATLLELIASQMRQTLTILASDGLAEVPRVDRFEPQLQSTKSIGDGAITLIDRHQPKAEDGMTWSTFHTSADQLPAAERTVFDLLYYHEMARTEVIDLLEISETELNRRWLSARRMILQEMDQSCQTTD